MEGGSANAYDYCSGDPINCNDLNGLRSVRQNVEWAASVGWYCFRTRSASKCDFAKSYGQSAEKVAGLFFAPETRQWDAFKHIYWHALMVSDGFGFRWSQGLGEAHESYSNNVDRRGDLTNNRNGAVIGQQFKEGKLTGDLAGYIEEFVRSDPRADTINNCASCLS